jgi:Ecdysteroid kinase-like family
MPAQVTPEWLTAALTEVRMLRRGRVIDAQWERVGQHFGFTRLVGRVGLQYEGVEETPPSSLIAKLPMAQGDVVSGYRARQERDPALARRHYKRSAREERFYREIGASFAPMLYYSAADAARRRVILLLEDLSAGRQGDVLHGCSIEDAALVVEQLAPFHARWWAKCAPTNAFPPSVADPKEREERYDRHVAVFLARYGDRLPAAVTRIVQLLRSRLGRVLAALNGGPQTLTHGDLHLDNLIFDGQGGRSVTVLDWQTVSVGAPARDLAPLLFGSLKPEDRRIAEGPLLDRYATLLAAHGVRGYSRQSLRLDCRLALVALLAGTIIGIASLEPDDLSERERALQDAAIADGRLIAALLDHDVDTLLHTDIDRAGLLRRT